MVWDPKGDGKQTIRASFGLMHDTTELFYPERWTTNAPYVSSLSLTSGQFSNPFASYTLNGKTGDPFPGAAVFPTQGSLHQRSAQHEGHLHDAVEPQLPAADWPRTGW